MNRALTIGAAAMAVVLSASPVLAQGGGQRSQGASQESRARGSSPEQGNQSARMLEDRVFVRLAEQAWAGGDFKVDAQGSTVTLSGTVPSEQTKQRMLRIARRTFGVTDVRDQLTVDPGVGSPPATAVDDRVLAQRVAQQIATALRGAKAGEDWWLTGWRVEGPDNRWTFTVEADNGNVWLEGEVPQHSHVRQAIDAARKVQGVRSVRSNLEIDRPYSSAYRYGYPGPYPGYAYRPYAYRYADRDDYRMDADGMNAHGFRGLHAMTGEVTKVDKQQGVLSLKTSQGTTLNLNFPPDALQNVNQGDRLTVEMGFKEAGAAGAASPRMDSGAQPQGQAPQQPQNKN